MKDKIIEELKATGRKGINKLIEWMEVNGFFSAPCSSQHHLCIDGGLAEHSMNVLILSKKLWYELPGSMSGIPIESIIITSLLHDLGKCGQYGKPNYVPNMISDRKGGFKQSDSKPFTGNPDLLNVPHEIRSINIASQFIALTEEESFAILYHNGLYGSLKYEIQGKETPLYLILHTADMWCSRVIEKEDTDGSEI
jgi:23S rRNA maturation-related 3'-5' exoribonuclease YhaM